MAESANATTIVPTAITDAAGISWSLVATAKSGQQVVRNGVIDTSTANVAKLVYANHNLYHQNTAGGWWVFQNGWVSNSGPTVITPTTTPPTTTPPTTTPTTTPIPTPTTSLTGTIGSIIDLNGAAWTLVASATSGLQSAINGKVDSSTANITLLLKYTSVIYQQNADGNWWSWTNNSWQGASDPRIVQPTGSNSVTVNLSSTTGGRVTKELYGVAMSTSRMNFGGSFNDQTWVNNVANFKFGLWRMQAENMMQSIFSGWGASPNWGVLDPVIRNVNKAFPNATIMWTGGWLPGYFNYSASGDQAGCADQFAQLARYFKSNGVKITYWDIFNEPDASSTPGSTASAVAATSAAVFNALKNVDSSYKFGGPCTSYINSGSYSQDLVNAYPNLDFISAHAYPSGGTNPGPAATFSQGIGVGQSISGANKFNGRTYAYSLNEYNVDYNCQDSDQQTVVGALYAALVTAVGAPRGLSSSAIWEIAQGDGTCSLAINSNTFAPNAYFLSRAGLTMPGNIVAAATNTPNVTVLATASNTGFAVQLINTGGNVNVAINLSGGAIPATVNRWELSNGNKAGLGSTIAGSSLSNVFLPAQSIVILNS